VVPAEQPNEEGVDFYVLQCQRRKHKLQAPLACPWGAEFEVGDFVIEGTYYKKSGRGEYTYTYLEKSVVAHVSSHLVVACKFRMKLAPYCLKGGDPVYKISSEVVEVVRHALAQVWENSDDE